MNEKILEALKTLADKLGTTAEYLWAVLVKQGKVDFILLLVLTSIGILFTFLFFSYFKKCERRVGTEKGKNAHGEMKFITWDDMNLNIIRLVVLGLVAVCFLVSAGVYLSDGINGLLNPEYAALSKILRML